MARGATAEQVQDQPVEDQPTEGQSNTAPTTEGEGTGADNGAVAEPSEAKRRMPTYTMSEVGDELPADEPAGRAKLYHDLLTPLTQDGNQGKWFEIAHFKTPTGARQAAKDLRDGKREIPKGEWEFDTRKVQNPDQPTKRHSKLYARFMG